VRWKFEMNGRSRHSCPREGTTAEKEQGIQEYPAALAYLSNRVRTTNGATNVSFFHCFTFNTDSCRRNPSNYWDSALMGYVQFLASNATTMVVGRTASCSSRGHVQDDAGDIFDLANGNKRMLVGEWGIHFDALDWYAGAG
jgi:hypothetical protein